MRAALLRIAIVAGEASGDALAADLINALRERHPNCEIEGIAGPRMIAAGCRALFPSEALSVMGLVEVIAHIPRIFNIRRQLVRHLLANPPDIFIGVDAPAFNLGLELRLRKAGIFTVHYHSPSVWAWKRKRIHKIARATNLMLTLFPFETAIYEAHHIPVRYVGHPLADTIPLQHDLHAARLALQLPAHQKVIALLPGSRASELRYLASLFLQTAAHCLARDPDLLFIVPMINATRRAQFEAIYKTSGLTLPLKIVEGHAHEAMAAADVVLLASGTATLEALLLKRPMVVAYRLSPLTYWLAKRLIKIPYFALPNILANTRLVPELLQDDATPIALCDALFNYLDDPTRTETLQAAYLNIHQQLRRNASHQAASAILDHLK